MTADTPPSERELVTRAQAGDEQALAQLFERSSPQTRRSLRTRLSPAILRRLSESDILQDTLMTATARLESFEYRGEGSFQRWLAGIAENTRRQVIRRHTQTKRRDVRAEVTRDARPRTHHHEGPQATASRLAMAREMQEAVAQALEAMSGDHRTVIQLLEQRRVTLVDAGELLGRSPNAVKKLHARALAELARRLGLDGEGTQ